MKKTALLLFALFIGLNVFGQRRRNISGIPQTNREPTEQEIAKHKRTMEERKQEYIANFVTTLEADDFQKEIIKQTLNSFFEAKLVIIKEKYERLFDREQAVEKLENTHFTELKELISEDDMTKIKEMIKGNFNEKDVVKKKRKKRKRRKKNKS